ncbi:hypothetical protein RY27_30330 [Litorilinea aerophila]|uniref:Uncharacterized protein n=1 Tax=Litorilinea aerophila TaxID=1204385 RepID=A0A540VIR5_9CHLR|nr:hypothetical protein RY27_30330 [Litorilinea aerophila]GIV77178.1 MAG: hypothetical protein KatS3mg050_1572 [Litorilinea sp.]
MGGSSSREPELVPLTRKAFYDLAIFCREYAQELARHDQGRVNLKHCHQFNAWLAQLKRYDRLAPRLATLSPARPIARWQLTVLGFGIGFLALLLLPTRFDRLTSSAILYTYLFGLIFFQFLPERLYGTTIELLEGKVLRVVELLEELLVQNELQFTEAAYFQVKENLAEARKELRQQIDLAHRRWR